MRLLVPDSLLPPGAAAALGEAVRHLRDGHHFHQRRLLRALLPPGGPRPPGRVLAVPGRFCHVGGRRVGHLWTHNLGLVLRPASLTAHPRAEPVGDAGGDLHHPAARELHEWFLPGADGDQPPVWLLLRGADVGGLRRGAQYRGSRTHHGGARAADAHRECRRAAGDTSVR